VRRVNNCIEPTELAIVLHGGLISGESFRLRPAVGHIDIGFFIFVLGSGFFVFRSFGDGWLTGKTLTRGMN